MANVPGGQYTGVLQLPKDRQTDRQTDIPSSHIPWQTCPEDSTPESSSCRRTDRKTYLHHISHGKRARRTVHRCPPAAEGQTDRLIYLNHISHGKRAWRTVHRCPPAAEGQTDRLIYLNHISHGKRAWRTVHRCPPAAEGQTDRLTYLHHISHGKRAWRTVHRCPPAAVGQTDRQTDWHTFITYPMANVPGGQYTGVCQLPKDRQTDIPSSHIPWQTCLEDSTPVYSSCRRTDRLTYLHHIAHDKRVWRTVHRCPPAAKRQTDWHTFITYPMANVPGGQYTGVHQLPKTDRLTYLHHISHGKRAWRTVHRSPPAAVGQTDRQTDIPSSHIPWQTCLEDSTPVSSSCRRTDRLTDIPSSHIPWQTCPEDSTPEPTSRQKTDRLTYLNHISHGKRAWRTVHRCTQAAEGQTDRQTDRQTGRQTDRQTDIPSSHIP